jgi:protein-disulfide isomerase
MTRGSALLGFVLCFLGGVFLMWGIDRGAVEASPDPDAIAFEGRPYDHSAAAVPITSQDPTWGRPEALATLVVFSDFQCPYCASIETTLAALRAKYGPEKLRVVWKHFPLPSHAAALPAHVAAEAAFRVGGPRAFWRFHDLCFEHRNGWSRERFVQWARDLGLDEPRFTAALDDPHTAAKVEADRVLARSIGVPGTPSFYLNGKPIDAARGEADFAAAIDEQLRTAEARLASGVAEDALYVTLSNEAARTWPARPEAEPIWRVPVGPDDPVRGGADALVTIVELGDFQCSFCAAVERTLARVLREYDGDVRLVWKDNPLSFHKRAVPAAMLAREAFAQKGDDGFWAAHDLLFERQRALDDESLFSYAAELGLDVDEVKRAVTTRRHMSAVLAAQELAAELSASGTPHFFINGRRLVGDQPFSELKRIVDEELAKARALGLRGDALYAKIVDAGQEAPAPERVDVGPPPKNAPWKGAEHAPVVIQVFSDFECPFCASAADGLRDLLRTHGDEVRIVWRDLPLPIHPNAVLAHVAAREAFVQQGNDGFWAMHDRIFADAKSLDRAALERHGAAVGLDLERLRKALDELSHAGWIDEQAGVAAAAGVRNTPGFVVNGYYVSGAQSFAKLRKLVERAAREAAH